MGGIYITGRNPVIELLRSNRKIDRIYISKGQLKGSIKKLIGMARDRNIRIQEVSKGRLDQMSEGGVHQGVAALISGFQYSSIDSMLNRARSKKEDPFIIILDEIEDPHNLGAITRTAECAGAHGVVIPERRAAQVNQTVYKASSGAVEYIPIARITNISDTIRKLKDEGLWVYGADMKGEDYHFNTDLKGAVALVIGNEGKGISRIVKENCDLLVQIPMLGSISSLNASTSAAILIYEVVRQNNGEKAERN